MRGRERERVETFSRGMRQRLHIARGLLHDPEVLFLDEPTIGLDPVGARELRETVAALRDSGKTILLTTHYMYEADELCGRVAVINGGRIVAEGTPASLKAAIADRTTIEVLAKGLTESCAGADQSSCRVSPRSSSRRARTRRRCLSSRGSAPSLSSHWSGLLDQVSVTAVSAREPTLEDAYVALVESK